MITYRKAESSDIKEMERLILEEGPNPYNYLPENDVKKHLQEINSGNVKAVLAVSEGKIIGFVSYISGTVYPQYENYDNKNKEHGYVVEAVVSKAFRGKGIGTKLLEMAKKDLLKMGFTTIYIKRHNENKASGMMMQKAGFEEVDTFYDPEIRNYGNRKTTVCRFRK